MINKQIISAYLRLDNKQTNRYLVKLGNEIRDRILLSKKNDEIYQNLELLEVFVYKVPKQAIEIFKYILKNSNPAKKSRTKFGVVEGKNRDDLVLKGLGLLGEIRYILPNQVLPLLEKVIATEEKDLREKAIEILKKFAKYNYHVLFKSKIGGF